METLEWKELLGELRRQWTTLWRERIDDKVRAEGMANRDYDELFVERGLVILATRDFKPLSFAEVLQKHKSHHMDNAPPTPSASGWGKFMRDVLSKQKRFTRKVRPIPPEPKRDEKQQRKKIGRGWLHL